MALASKIGMVLIVVASWCIMALVARGIVRPIYSSGLVAMRTSRRSFRKKRLSRVVASTWIYTSIFVVMLTALAGIGIMRRDPEDSFGFQRHVLSWQYMLHPNYALAMCACAVAASCAAVVKFRSACVGGAIDSDAFGKSWGVGMAVFVSVGAAALLVDVFLDSMSTVPGATAMPGGSAVSTGIAVLLAARSHLGTLGSEERDRWTLAVRDRLEGLGLSGGVIDVIQKFVRAMPARLDESAKILVHRMIATGFDRDTAAAARDGAMQLRNHDGVGAILDAVADRQDPPSQPA